MTTYLGKSCSFCLPRVPFVNCRQFMYLVISLLILMWDLIVSVHDHCLSFYFPVIWRNMTEPKQNRAIYVFGCFPFDFDVGSDCISS